MSNNPIAVPQASRLALAIVLALSPFSSVLAADRSDPTTLDTVEVKSRLPERIQVERSLTPGGVTVVDGETFFERSVNNMSDSLRYVPGVWTDSASGGDAIFISSRGSNLDATDYDSNGIKLFQDGLPVTTADGNNHNRFIDPLAGRYAIIARGANALTYGASTLGGAIDFVSPTARNSSPVQLYVNGGSHGLLSGRATFGSVSGDLDGQLTLEGKRWDGYREHSKEDRSSVYANGGWQVSDAFSLRLYATHIDSDIELPGALTRAQLAQDPDQANPSALSGNFQLNVKSDRLAAKGVWEIDADRRLEFGLSYEDQNLYHPIVDKVMVDFDGPGPMQPVEVFSLLKNTDQRTWGGMIRYNVRSGNHDVLVGANLADTHERGGNYRNDGGRRNGQWGVIDNRSNSAEIFLIDRWKFAPQWTLVYGAQGVFTGRDVRNIDLDSGTLRNPKHDYTSFNPRLGVIRALSSSNELFASISRLYEAPTTFELEDDTRGDGSTLNAMRGTVAEIGMRGSNGAQTNEPRWHWDVAAYYARLHDEILSVDDPAAPGTSLSTNIDRTTHAGIEALLGASFPFGDGAHRIEPLVSAIYNAFSFDADPVYGGNDLPAAPKYAVRGEVMYRHQSGFYIGPTFDLVGSRWADFSNTYKVDSYRLLGLRAGIARNNWELFVEGRNLTDKTYVATMSVRDAAAADAAILQPGAPRSVYAGMRYQF